MRFTVYDPATGEILRSGSCHAEDLELQAEDGEAVIEGAGDDLTQRVENGAIVAKS